MTLSNISRSRCSMSGARPLKATLVCADDRGVGAGIIAGFGAEVCWTTRGCGAGGGLTGCVGITGAGFTGCGAGAATTFGTGALVGALATTAEGVFVGMVTTVAFGALV